eukprot:c21679_g1_i2.p1 GENE.c21679_g1_i2~~c21679_g1_i2.p1  ORF type:complete len:152 (+),score=37.46 c21679_g1_i2:52-456(+)
MRTVKEFSEQKKSQENACLQKQVTNENENENKNKVQKIGESDNRPVHDFLGVHLSELKKIQSLRGYVKGTTLDEVSKNHIQYPNSFSSYANYVYSVSENRRRPPLANHFVISSTSISFDDLIQSLEVFFVLILF